MRVKNLAGGLLILVFIIINTGCQSVATQVHPTNTISVLAETLTPNNLPSITTEIHATEIYATETSTPHEMRTHFDDIKPGQYLLVQSYTRGEPYLYVITTGGETVKKISADVNWGTSNDGSQLLVMQPPPSEHVNNFDSLTKKWTNLDLKNECYEANWSIDKKYIAFGCGNGGAMDIYVRDNISGSMTKVTDCWERDYVCSTPSWSFDGQWLAYRAVEARSGTDTLHAIYFFNVSCIQEGNCIKKRIGPVDSDTNPTWSPTNELILVLSGSMKFYHIKNGSAVLSKEIKTNMSDIRYVSGSPDGKYVSYASIDNKVIYILSRLSNTSEVLLQDENITIIGWLVMY